MGPRGFRRRGRRRGLIVGAAVGSAVARHNSAKNQQPEADEAEGASDYTAELTELQKLRAQDLITEDEYQAKKKQVLGI